VSIPASPEAIFDILFEIEGKIDAILSKGEKAKTTGEKGKYR
jgi:hypothetical protein